MTTDFACWIAVGASSSALVLISARGIWLHMRWSRDRRRTPRYFMDVRPSAHVDRVRASEVRDHVR